MNVWLIFKDYLFCWFSLASKMFELCFIYIKDELVLYYISEL